jgi:FtsP/CotA-like multicopper oxidase with cupredoxin domain
VASDKINANNAATINNISMLTPPFPLLSQRSLYNESIFCDRSSPKNCMERSKVCQCIHRLKVKLNSIVEVVLIDLTDPFTHPFHLHGHKFFVMDVGNFDNTTTLEDIVSDDEILRKSSNTNPPLKDTVLIPNSGYARIKFKADNPGFWIGHCHYDYHL